MSDGIKMGSECEVVGRGCYAVEMGNGEGREAVELGTRERGCRPIRVGASTYLRLYFNFLTPEWDSGSIKHHSKLIITLTLFLKGQLVHFYKV